MPIYSQMCLFELPALRFGGDLAALADVESVIVLGNDVWLSDLRGPPAKCGHVVLERADAEALVFPQGDQGLNVFRL